MESLSSPTTRVLILSQYFWPESFRINEIAQALKEAGCEVAVLTGQPNYPDGEVFAGYRACKVSTENLSGFKIYRVPLAPRGRGSAIRLFINYLSFVVAGSVIGPWVLRKHRFDVIFVYGISPILQAIPGVVLRRTTGGSIVTWVQDLWPQSLEVTGFVRNQRILKLVASVVRWIYRRSDLILVQSRGFIPMVRSMCAGVPIEYHPNPGELSFEAPVQASVDLTLSPGFNVVFAGNLGTAQGLETILSAAQILRTESEIRLVLIGGGSRREWLLQEVARLGLSNVQLPGRYPAQQMPGILAQASVLLVSLVRNPIMSQTIPSKIQAYLAAGKPIIAALDGEGASVVNEANAGLSCPAEDAAALAAAVIELRDMPQEQLKQMGFNGRFYYEQNFEPAMLAQRLAERFKTLARTRGRDSGKE